MEHDPSSTARRGRHWLLGALLAACTIVAGAAPSIGVLPAFGASVGFQATEEPAPEPEAPLPEHSLAARTTGAAARQAPCRPSAPVVTPIPGRSVAVYQGSAECSTVALTFDAGADRGYAELILDILRENDVPASFGMTGAWAEQNPDLVQRIAEDGHEFINHTWDHRSFTGFSPLTRPLVVDERRLQLERTEELIFGLTGRSTRPHFRPPYGDMDDGVLKDVADAGYDYTIMWTVDSLGWNRLPAAAIVDRCLSRVEPGTIYIFHVGAQSEDALALGQIIDGLRDRGFGFVTVTDLLGL